MEPDISCLEGSSPSAGFWIFIFDNSSLSFTLMWSGSVLQHSAARDMKGASLERATFSFFGINRVTSLFYQLAQSSLHRAFDEAPLPALEQRLGFFELHFAG